MVANSEENKVVNQAAGNGKKKKSFGRMFLSFLMYGGWILILVVILGIVIGVQMATK